MQKNESPQSDGRAGLSRRGALSIGGRLAAAGTFSGTLAVGAAMAQGKDNETVVRAFIAAWSNLNAAELVAYFTEDGTYHNMMLDPVSGHADLQEFIMGFLASWSETHWELINIASQGDLVFAERMDRTRIGDKRVALPCFGVFEMAGGKIRIWRDYFDLATYTSVFA